MARKSSGRESMSLAHIKHTVAVSIGIAPVFVHCPSQVYCWSLITNNTQESNTEIYIGFSIFFNLLIPLLEKVSSTIRYMHKGNFCTIM